MATKPYVAPGKATKVVRKSAKVTPPAKVVRTPVRSNKGGATRGQARASQVQSMSKNPKGPSTNASMAASFGTGAASATSPSGRFQTPNLTPPPSRKNPVQGKKTGS